MSKIHGHITRDKSTSKGFGVLKLNSEIFTCHITKVSLQQSLNIKKSIVT